MQDDNPDAYVDPNETLAGLFLEDPRKLFRVLFYIDTELESAGEHNEFIDLFVSECSIKDKFDASYALSTSVFVAKLSLAIASKIGRAHV
jgi:hypothetical protein